MRAPLFSQSLLRSISALGLTTCLICGGSNAFAQDGFYRYLNKDGVKVLNRSIPPEYAQHGYEVLNASGQVIKVVPPRRSDGEIAQEVAKEQLLEKYAELSRRYSSLDDIESAKLRRLKNIETNISILRGNISGLNTQIENLMSKAAEQERAGKDVSQRVLQSLEDARAELSVAEGIMANRTAEYKKVADKFDSDVVLFVKGQALQAHQHSTN